MTAIRRFMSIWILALAGSLLLPQISLAAVSGMTYGHGPTTTTTPAIIAEHASVAGTDRASSVGVQDITSGQTRTLFFFSRSSIAPKSIDDLVDLTDHRKDHILNRHRSGAGKPGKTEFPADWSDERILHEISDVATDPKASTGVGKWGETWAEGTRGGVDIHVDLYPPNSRHVGKISTGYPTNVKPNP